MSITIDGQLTEPGRYAQQIDGRPVLTLYVHACIGGQFEAEIIGEDTPDMHQRFELAATSIHSGANCQISGARLTTRNDVFVLSMLDLVVLNGKQLVL